MQEQASFARYADVRFETEQAEYEVSSSPERVIKNILIVV